ncbi:hypothetical protein JOH51_001651 [Rhizobium leguminosarum]|nr:hypothetical protein [Rhizobium leguminosarum]MBP2444212.1 hypothetical protein [Rhizobium leguminosarum]
MGQGPNEFLLDIGQKGIGIDRPVEDPWCIEPVISEGCDKRHRSPMTVRDMGDQAFAPFAPATERRHIRLHPGFVNEHKAIRIDLALMALPPFTLAGQLRPVLLGRQHGFFEAFAFAMEKAADIGWMDFEAAILQSPRQPLRRHMLRPIDHRQDPDAMLAADQRPVDTAHLARLNTAATALALRPLDHARRRDIQSGGNRMTCLALPHTCHRPFSQIHRISTTHRTSLHGSFNQI